MNTLCIVGILFVLCCFIALIEPALKTRQCLFLYASVGVAMVLIAGLRDGNTVGDYKVYLEMYRFPEETPTVEPTFTLISSLVKAVCPWPVLLFVIYASIGVTCKIFAIKRLTSLLFLSLVIYISNVYLLHDMTQIRAGVASGIFLLAIRPLAEHKIFRYTALILLASLFHYSSLLLLPLVVLKNQPIASKSKYLWWSIVPLGFIVHSTMFDISVIPIESIRLKLEMYQHLQEQSVQGFTDANLFNPYFLFRCALYYGMLWKRDTIGTYNPYFPLLIKIEGIALFLFPALSFISLLGYRGSELLGVVEIILYPLFMYAFRPRIAAKMAVIGIGTLLLAVNIIHKHLIFT